MAVGVINCGICGFTINVKAVTGNGQKVNLEITSDCPHYQKIAEELKEVVALKEAFKKLHMGTVYQAISQHCPHPSCIGVSGILKTVEVAAGLALPQTASIVVTKE